jgi:transcriptional regulator with XRE-family HTH domain
VIDQLSDAPTGVTFSLVSSWERGTHRPGPRYASLLCRALQATPEELGLLDEDTAEDGVGSTPLELVVSYVELQEAMADVIAGAEECLAVTGSRSRDERYLTRIEAVLQARPRLTHYRILYGPPRHQVLKDHLQRLLKLRDPADRSLGYKTLHIGMADGHRDPERFFVASERSAVVVIPSLTGATAYDTGLVMADPALARGLVQHAREAYMGAERIETPEAVAGLALR